MYQFSRFSGSKLFLVAKLIKNSLLFFGSSQTDKSLVYLHIGGGEDSEGGESGEGGEGGEGGESKLVVWLCRS